MTHRDPIPSKNRSRFHGTAAGWNHRQKVCTDCRTKYTVSLFFIDGQTGLSLCEDKFSPQNPRRAFELFGNPVISVQSGLP